MAVDALGEPIEELPYLHENLAIVPHYLPEKNPFVNELTEKRNIPVEAVLGGPETMYPEFMDKIKQFAKEEADAKAKADAENATKKVPTKK